MANIRNSYELKLLREGGKIAALALKRALGEIKVGVREIDVDKIAERTIYKLGGDLSYKTVPNYPFATCITVNDDVVHGLPTERKFKEGDIVGCDLAVLYKGWHTDCAWTILLGRDSKKEVFLKAGEEALWDAVDQATDGNNIGDISYAIQKRIEKDGYSVVRSLVGHGIGRNLHEDPEIPGYGNKGAGIKLKSGMTLAIEVIYTSGKADVALDQDGWTFKTVDGSWGAVFEMTVVVGKKKPEILTDWRNV